MKRNLTKKTRPVGGKAGPDAPEDIGLSTEEGLRRVEDENRKLRAQIKEVQRGSTLFKLLANTIEQQPPFSTFTPYSSVMKKKSKIKESALLVLSDCHADQEILSKRVQGLENFNFDVACRRAERIVDTTISHLVDNMKNYKFERLYIAGLGDYVNGDIHNATMHSKWKNTLKNAVGMGELFAMMITDLSKYFPEIVLCSVSGNHGRRSFKKDYRGAQDNWDYLVATHVATRLRDLVSEKRLSLFFPDSWSLGLNIYNRNFVMNHGDDIRCFAPGAPVAIKNGVSKYIESIEKGDFVLCSDGDYREVIDTFEYDHDGDIVHISAETLPNNTWTVTPNHEVFVVPKQKVSESYIDATPEWMPAGHVSVGDYLVVPTPKVKEEDIVTEIKTSDFRLGLSEGLHHNEKSIPDIIKISENLGYIVGQYLADGSVFGQKDKVKGSNYDNILEISYNSEEKDFWEEYVRAWEEIFNDTPSLLSRKDLDIRCQRLHCYGQRAVALIKGLAGEGSHTKKLHNSVLKWPVDALKGLIIGYLRGDGHTRRHMFHEKYRTHRVNASTCSAELGSQLFWIARRCGFNLSIKYRTRSGNLEGHIGFYADDARFLGPLTQRNYEVFDDDVRKARRGSFSSGDYFLAKVTKAYRSLYKGKKYDIAVEGLHDYTVNGAVVHNSWNSIPWYGIERKTRRLNAIGAVSGNIPHYFLFGHFHTIASQQHTTGETIINGSWSATDEYALNSLGAFSEPFQWLMGVHPSYGVTWRLPIKLRSADWRAEDTKPGRYSVTIFEDMEGEFDNIYRQKNDNTIYL